MNLTATKNRKTISRATLLQSILEEIRMLRNELAILIPSENIDEYAHPSRIKKSYAKALRQHPPAEWK